ncbi:TetR/AcrR family transcriptional regulator [Pseudonocardia abyssalis]|uniref:TetR/AcrR family transcriptional regulator C-terminal domain-containing protein n=1 Tax=Pseudonocardia abyssalis TaxID=2792008 RepID=A0ABS6UNY3_9PSEU|nr:TetR family transcriptional regulator [Pseudonocardia abyssalis]MBW0114788.1 TetR/AcrR family transcriptional regulator C-terminal domain-containing protein [Pseudonocardia abyssalis]MBW0133968.1 TetR/AcrR family transcriptional regulator C-terminal domain-containing protein [Pseudonocardia abyssalis]
MARGRRAGGHDPLTPERIIDAALLISDAESDLDRLTVRRLAAELGVGTMTLYSYFRSKGEILDAMADHVLGRMRLPAEPAAGPDEALRSVADAFLAMMREHPSVVRLLATRITNSRTALRGAMESVLAHLVAAGVPGPTSVRCYGFLITYAIGFVSYQTPRPWGRQDVEEAAEVRRQRSHFYAGLPRDDFPQMVALADHLVDLPSDEQYRAGVDAFIESVVRGLPA